MNALRMSPIAIALAVAACGGGSPPVLLNGSPQGVVVRYSQSSGKAADASAAAEKFCAQYGRKAVQGEGSEMTGDTFLSFTCQKP